MPEHVDIGVAEIHIPYNWSYADAAARTAASGFVAGDVGKFARQTDDNSIWMLTATTPTWEFIGGGGHSAWDFKQSVRVATTANITLSGTQTIDGVSVIAGDRVLVKDQSTGANNGIYVCAAGAWSRAVDFDVSAEVTSGVIIPVEEGTANGDKLFMLTTNNPITLGSTSLTFAAYGAATVPSLTATYIGYGDGSNLLTGSANLAWDESTKVLTLANSSGTGFIDLEGSGNNGAIRMQGATHPDQGGGVILPFVGGGQSTGPGLWWSDGTFANTVGLWLASGLNYQGDGGNPQVKIRKSTDSSSNGDIVFVLSPNTGALELAPFGTSAGETSAVRLFELAANGSNYFAIRAADNIATTRTMLAPNDDPVAGDKLKVTSYSGNIITTEWSPTDATFMVSVSDETTAIIAGTGKITFRMPFAMTLTGVRASLTTAATSGTFTVDINEGGSTILSTKLTIDANEKTSTTAATPAVISDTALADDAEITIDVDDDAAGDAAGLKVTLIGTRT